MPTADDLRALARSSPWRWRTVRFVLHVDRGWPVEPVRAWIRRPDALRVETLDGVVRQSGFEVPAPASRVVLTAAGGTPPLTTPLMTEPAPPVGQVFRDDGLVADRSAVDRWDHDAPFYRDYHWVALLDPVELADGDPDRGDGGAGTGVQIDQVTETRYADRPAWAAVVRPTAGYDPRCGCCPLLPCAVADELEGLPVGEYAPAHRVVLDVGTGICVATEQLGGPRVGQGHRLLLEAVEEPVDDAVFSWR